MYFRAQRLFGVAMVILFVLGFSAQRAHAFTLSKSSIGNTLGLVGYWTFDGKDMPQGLVRDISGAGNHGSQVGMATATAYAQGKIGQALSFDGVDDAVVLGTGSSITDIQDQGGGGMTVAFWINPAANTASAQTLIGKGGNNASSGTWVITKTNTTNPARFAFKKDGTVVSQKVYNSMLETGVWQHMVVTWNGSMTFSTGVQVYKNGVLVVNNSATDGSGATSDSGKALCIGANTNIGTPTTCNPAANTGDKIAYDDVRIYNRVLSASEVLALYNQSSAKFNKPTGLVGKDGLIAHYTFDGVDMPQGLVRDISGNARHASSTGAATSTLYAMGKIGQALNFDGVDDYISTPTDFIGTSAVSVVAWIYPRSTGEAGVGRIVTNNKFNFRTSSSAAGILELSSDGVVSAASAAGTFGASSFKKWYQVAATRDASGTANIYINGLLSGAANQSSGTPAAGATNVIIGNSNTANATFDGLIDDVRIYNRVLTAAEIAELYSQSVTKANTNTVTPALTTGLVAHWTFDGKDTQTGLIRDLSGNGNIASSTNAATSTFYVQGKMGQALYFDGVDDKVDAGSGTTIDDIQNQGGGGMTISLWVKPLSNNSTLLAKNGPTSGWFRLELQPSGRISFSKDGATDLVARAGLNSYTTGVWQHIAVTWDGSVTAANVLIYVNGVIMTHDSESNAVSFISDAANDLVMGARSDGSALLQGALDDVRLYNRVLTQAEIQKLYQQSIR